LRLDDFLTDLFSLPFKRELLLLLNDDAYSGFGVKDRILFSFF